MNFKTAVEHNSSYLCFCTKLRIEQKTILMLLFDCKRGYTISLLLLCKSFSGINSYFISLFRFKSSLSMKNLQRSIPLFLNFILSFKTPSEGEKSSPHRTRYLQALPIESCTQPLLPTSMVIIKGTCCRLLSI